MKLVQESLNEFKKGLDPVDSLGLGRRTQIKEWLDLMEITNYTINYDLTIDVDGGVDLFQKDLKKIPEFIQFGEVIGNFWCNNNSISYSNDNKLTSLRGAPKIVKGSFACSYNELTSLNGCPKYVGNDFYCGGNKVKFIEDDVRKVCEVKRDIVC